MSAKKIKNTAVHALLEKGAHLYDMRDAIAYRDGTVKGAKHLALRNISTLFKLPKDSIIILFGTEYDDVNVSSAANYLHQYGYTKVYDMGSKDNF